MNLEEIKKNHKLVNLFVELCEIPSPPFKEKVVSEHILEIFSIYGVKASYDAFDNVIAKIPASSGFESVPPILLSAHMDVVGDSSEVNVCLSNCERYIETDKKRTLGADNKAGVAAIMDLAIELNKLNSGIEHGPIEITFTRDEEKSMAGMRNLDTSKINSKYALIADGEYLGEMDVEGASFTNIIVSVHGAKGGHSGIDIDDETRINALKVLSEMDMKIPQGVYKKNENGVITSINAGASIGGYANTYAAEAIKEAYELAKNKEDLPEKFETKNLMKTIAKESMLNVITTDAIRAYSLRSSDPENEQELIEKIKNYAKELNSKYKDMIRVDVDFEYHMRPFVKSDDETLSDVVINSAKDVSIKCAASSFHAGAETHILQNEKVNSKGEKFEPLIIGIADLKNIHSSDEQIEWKSFLKGREWLERIVVNFAKNFKNK